MKKLLKKFYSDIWGMLFIALGLFTIFSLMSYSPQDPSFSAWTVSKSANYCGFLGGFFADILLQTFGLASWCFAGYFLIIGVKGLKGQLQDRSDFRIISMFVTIFIICSLLELHYSKAHFLNNRILLSGLVGFFITKGFISILNPVGTGVVLWSIFFIHIIFISETHFSVIVEKTTQFLSTFFNSMINIKKTAVATPKYSRPLFIDPEVELKREREKEKEQGRLKNDNLSSKEKSLKDKIVNKLLNENPKNDLVVKREAQIEVADLSSEKTEANFIKKIFNKKEDKQKNLDLKSGQNVSEDKAEVIFDENSVVEEEKEVSKELNIIANKSSKRVVTTKANIPAKIENWKMPKLNLLEDPPATRARVDKEELKRKAELLTEKLKLFDIEGAVVAVKSGPAVTMFEFKPNADVKLSTITSLENDLAIALSSESLRIIAPIPGRDVVGIESSNSIREMVYLKDLIAEESFWKEDVKLPIALGKQTNGDPQIVDLRKMPHLLVAGSTGSGKSVFTVSAISGMIFKHSPKTLKLILIDPKQVDLAAFTQIPHLLMPPIIDSTKAVNALRWAVKEMDKRYRSMSKFGARGLEAYNETINGLSSEELEKHVLINQELEQKNKKNQMYYHKELPYIVVVVEEFGDLMQIDSDNVEGCVVRLAQLARACGIHLILCMQSPRKEVVTGLIKTNIPGRISFKVASKMDSRIILDESGAERLLARGDMLFRAPGTDKPLRYHGPWVSDPEIAQVAKFWSDQSEPAYDPKILELFEDKALGDTADTTFDIDEGGNEYDEMYDEVVAYVASLKEVSASLLQRKYRFGYPRAARLVEMLEKEKVVGPSNGSKPRQVLIQSFPK